MTARPAALMAVLLSGCASAGRGGRAMLLPAEFEGDRIVLRAAHLPSGEELCLFTDTGGGYWMTDAAAARLGLAVSSGSAAFPALAPTVPPPVHGGTIPVLSTAAVSADNADCMHGMLGAPWFADRVWLLDYPARRMSLVDSPPATSGAEALPLGMREGLAYARVTAVVDGEPLELLFDTGATVLPSTAAAAALGLPEGTRSAATSFIIKTVFERWRARHPGWRVVEGGDSALKEPLLEVPAVTVGSRSVGPVWFTRRQDGNFTEWMSQWTDKTIVGALGGNVWRDFAVLLDYPGRRVLLFKPKG